MDEQLGLAKSGVCVGAPTKTVVLTGLSSFTGSAFARTLADRGHHVIGTLTQPLSSYEQKPRICRRLAQLKGRVRIVDRAPVGSDNFHNLLAQQRADVLALHHAVVGDYRSTSFDVGSAVSFATSGADAAMRIAAETGCKTVILTRSVFEESQGLTDERRPIGSYAVAKTATVETWRMAAERYALSCSDFTICNPVGALEEPRFLRFLASKWLSGDVPVIAAPQLVRDNIPIPLLAAAFADFLECVDARKMRLTPSFWVGTNLSFAHRVAHEFSMRLYSDCPVAIASQWDQSEPRVRIGIDALVPTEGWVEKDFWDAHFEYTMHELQSV